MNRQCTPSTTYANTTGSPIRKTTDTVVSMIDNVMLSSKSGGKHAYSSVVQLCKNQHDRPFSACDCELAAQADLGTTIVAAEGPGD
jgi:hypothetical protein